jgi:ankyrin repeat protein
MRFALMIACLFFAPAFTFAQEKHNLDGPDSALKEFAKAYNDNRAIEQIKRDNSLIRAGGKGDCEAIRKALKEGARINSRYIDGNAFLDDGDSGYTVLMFAVLGKRTDAIKLIIENKADLEVRDLEGWTALYHAVVEDNQESVALLVKAGAKQDPVKLRLSRDLIKAACKGFNARPHERYPPSPGGPAGDTSKDPDLRAVLKQGADVNLANPKGYTALMFAANLGLVANVETLLANGADATMKSVNGETAFYLAGREVAGFRVEERRAVVKVLKEHLATKR